MRGSNSFSLVSYVSFSIFHACHTSPSVISCFHSGQPLSFHDPWIPPSPVIPTIPFTQSFHHPSSSSLASLECYPLLILVLVLGIKHHNHKQLVWDAGGCSFRPSSRRSENQCVLVSAVVIRFLYSYHHILSYIWYT